MDWEIRFERVGAEPISVRVSAGRTLLEAAQEAGLPIATACDGSGLCSRCGLEIRAGAEALSAEDEEERRAKQRNRIPAEHRLSCLAQIQGPVTASAGYW